MPKRSAIHTPLTNGTPQLDELGNQAMVDTDNNIKEKPALPLEAETGVQPKAGASLRIIESLTKREYEVAVLASEGLSNAQIANRIGVTVRTIESHMRNALEKLGTNRRTELPKLFSEGVPQVGKPTRPGFKAEVEAFCKGKPRTIQEVAQEIPAPRKMIYQYLKELGLHKKVEKRSHDGNVNP